MTVTIEETDLLFIDTLHVYAQLAAELNRHQDKVRQYIVLHDTSLFADRDEGHDGGVGLWPAVEALLAEGRFVLKARFHNNNGLTILERRVPPVLNLNAR